MSERLAVSPKEAFEMLGIGVTKGYELIGSGEFDTFKIGRATRITVASVEAYIGRRLLCRARDELVAQAQELDMGYGPSFEQMVDEAKRQAAPGCEACGKAMVRGGVGWYCAHHA